MKQERRQNGRCNRVVRLKKPDGLSEARDFSHGFFTNPETLGCVVKAWMVQMAVRGYSQIPYYILYMRAYRNTRKKMQKKYKKKIIQNLADFAY